MSGNRHNNGALSAMAANGGVNALAQELQWVKNDCALIRNAVVLLEQEKDNLRQAVRKLKLENQRMREKVKKLSAKVKELDSDDESAASEEVEYDDLGRGDFLLLGGAQDPLSLRYEVSIRDDNGVEHKSAERYYWYKMAEHFEDKEVSKRILEASNTQKAEEAMKEISGFKEDEWNKVKLTHWTRGQELKLEQVRWIACLLVESKGMYLAVAHQDKVFGTGWRKNRDEANKPIFWDGRNEGGKFLMKYRKGLETKHEWAGPNEKEETRKKYGELRRMVWRRIEQQNGGYPNHRGGSAIYGAPPHRNGGGNNNNNNNGSGGRGRGKQGGYGSGDARGGVRAAAATAGGSSPKQ